MITSIPLSDGWTLRAVDPVPGSPADRLSASIPATVPGTVHTDLLTAGLIEDPYLDLNETRDDWIGHTAWLYHRTIHWAGTNHDRTDLAFDGLDTIATIRLNGVPIGTTANQHRRYRFDVSGVLRLGANELEIEFSSAWAYAERLESELGSRPNAYPTPFNFIRKMAANFGWDWGPQLVTAGIWKEVRLESWSLVRLSEVSTQATVDGVDGVATVSIAVQTTGAGATEGRVVRVDVAGMSAEAFLVDGRAQVSVRVHNAPLWWPRGMGAQPLVDLTIRVSEGDQTLDRHVVRIGFRSVELNTSEDEGGAPFTLVINGIPTFIRGANWIPDDCFPSRLTRQRYRDRIEQAAGANLNLLRVWGGGIYERDEFYQLCDELGMLTWQDFLFACAAYPEESPLWDEVEAEARDNVERLSSHPSLVLWNGCNENIWGWFDWDWQSPLAGRTWGLGYYTELLPSVVAEIAPMTPYWPGSPFSGTMNVHANEPSFGNIHIWDVWNQVDYRHYADYNPRFVSEFGFQGPPTWSTLTRAIHDQPLAPDSPGMLLHQKANDGNGKLARGLAPHLPVPETMEDWHYLTQLNQARAVSFGIEHFRSQRPNCMGTVVWQLNDCWPVTSWAAIDGDGRRKPLWHALRRSNAERLLTFQPSPQGLQLVAVNDGMSPWTVSGDVVRMAFDGTELASMRLNVEVPALATVSIGLNAELFETVRPIGEVLVAVVPGERPVTHLFAEDRNLYLEPSDISLEASEWRSGEQKITLTASTFTRGVTVFPDRVIAEAWVNDCDLDLLPGVPATLTILTPRPIDAASLKNSTVLRQLNTLVAAESIAGLRVSSGER